MGLFSDDIQRTSVTQYIETLSNLAEIDWLQFQQLVESILMQEGGSLEAVEAIRKRLKHGGTQQKMRVLEVLQLLMENTNQRFRHQLVSNEKMKERFELILSSSMESNEVKKFTLQLLGAWISTYKNEPGMQTLSTIYQSGMARTGQGHRVRSRSGSEGGPTQVSSPLSPTQQSPAKPSRPRSQSTAAAISNTTTVHQNHNRPFDFRAEKPKIIEQIALANQHVNNLINALRLINTHADRWEMELERDARIQEHRTHCEESKRKIVRYARLVEDEEWIGTLLSTNEELLKALDMYDMMAAGQIPSPLSAPVITSATTSPRDNPVRRLPPPPPSAASTSLVPITPRSDIRKDLSSLQLTDTSDNEDPFADPVGTERIP